MYRIWHLVRGVLVSFEMPAGSWQQAQMKFMQAFRDRCQNVPDVVIIEHQEGKKWIVVWSKV